MPAVLPAILTYAALVVLMWLPFNPCGGMPYESHFLYLSESSPFTGFLFRPDSLRPYTSFFYHVSFVLGEALGVGGSFVPFQVVYALLWWARGFLVYLILRRLLPRQPLFAFCCGALVIVHASDHALMWVGQLNQFGFIFWMLLACYLLVRALQTPSMRRACWTLAAALLASYLSLWSYESHLLLMLAAPVLVFLAERPRPLERRALLAAWYSVPAVYLACSAYQYLFQISGSYQTSVLRPGWTLSALAGDLRFNLLASVRFWRWTDNLPPLAAPEWSTAVGAAGAAIFTAGILAAAAIQRHHGRRETTTPRRCAGLLFTGGALLVLSFPAYLLLDDATSLWRTQFLSGIGTALVWTSLAALVSSALPVRWPRSWTLVIVGAVLAWHGAAAALRLAAMHDRVWTRQRVAVENLLALAPRLRDQAVVVALDVPKAEDPFLTAAWFDFALKLAYPGSDVTGIYFYEDGSAAGGNHLRLKSAQWVWDGPFENPTFEPRSVGHTLVIAYGPALQARVIEQLPAQLEPSAEDRSRYSPADVILSGPPPVRALRRYGPCPPWWWTLSPGR